MTKQLASKNILGWYILYHSIRNSTIAFSDLPIFPKGVTLTNIHLNRTWTEEADSDINKTITPLDITDTVCYVVSQILRWRR